MTAQHTPGPWLYTQEGVDAFGIVTPDGHSIVHLVALHNSTAARDLPANARLIAAAPDMLEALQNLENDDGNSMPDSAWKLVKNAILKATGETK